MRKAVFLDKDGTLIENVPFNVDSTRVRLTPSAGTGLQRLQAHGYHLIVVSNQPGIARGYFPYQALCAVEKRIDQLLAPFQARISAYYYCPHDPLQSPCACRKPAPGLLERASREHGIDLRRSWLVGDILNDIEAGARAGCRTVLLDNGNETEWVAGAMRRPDHRVADLLEAAERILAAEVEAERVP